MSFAKWLILVDMYVWKEAAGFDHTIIDLPYRQWYAEHWSPQAVARCILNAC